MGDTPAKVLGDFFADQEFPEDQKSRIAHEVASKSSLCARVMRTYVTRTDAYLDGFEKHEHIKGGARPGTTFYRTRAIEILAEWLADNRVKAWKIYRQAAILFIAKELPGLDELLSKVQLPQGAIAVSDLLRLACSRCSEYQVSRANILQFYEVWGVERVPNFESSMDDWMKPDELAIQRRQVGVLEAQLHELTKAVAQTTAEATALRQLVTDTQQRQADDRAAQKATIDARRTLTETVTSLEEKARREDGRLRALEDATKNLRDSIEKVRRETPAISAFKSEIERLEVSTKAAMKATTDATRTALADSFRSELAQTKVTLESQVQELSSRLSETATSMGRLAGGARYRSPLTRAPQNVGPRANITSELAFMQSFALRLLTEHELEMSLELAAAYHRGFLANDVIVSEWPYVKSWLDCLDWHAFTVQLAATPTWSAEEHWAEGAEHLFQDGTAPRLAVIHNYDVGMIDYYLSPSLSLWYRNGLPPRPRAKLFLIPAGSEPSVTTLLTEHAFVCGRDPRRPGRALALRDATKPPPMPQRDPAPGVDPAVMSTWWRPSDRPTADLQRDLLRIQKSLGCTFSASLSSGVRNTCASVRSYLSDVAAAGFAIDCHVVPWVHAKYNGDKDNDLRTLVAPLQSVAE